MGSAAKQGRRLGAEDSEQRTRFVDAAEAALMEDGYKAISARSIAARAGLKPQLLYYYFRTMDDLMRAVVQRVNARRNERLGMVLAADRPLHALWRDSIETSSAGLAAELTSMAHHRAAVRDEIVASAEAFRRRQATVLREIFARRGTAPDEEEAAGLVMIGVALSRMIVSERALGFTEAHEPALAMVEKLLDRIEPPAG